MRPIVRVLICVVLVGMLAAPTPSPAQSPNPPPAAVKAAQDLLAAMGSAKQFDAVLPLIMQQTRTLMVQGRGPDVAAEIDKVLPTLVQRFGSRKAELLDEIAVAYARRVSLADLQAAIAFFTSDAGKRFVELQPQLTQESMMIGQRWGLKIGQQVDLELREELKKRGIQL